MVSKLSTMAVAAVLSASAASAAAAAAGDPIGSTVKVVNQVTAELDRETRALKTGDGVRQQELVAVGADSVGELEFLDKTKLALGPGSKLLLDKFVYDPSRTGGSIVVNLVKGSFRFITGLAHKPAYVVRTPTAAISVRGTIFDLFVQVSGMTWLLLHEGVVEICNLRGKCRLIDEPGKLIRVTDQGDVGIPVRWSGLPGSGAVPFENAFPFVVAPPSIDPTPILTREAILEDAEDKEETPQETETPRKAETPDETKGGDKKSTTVTKPGGSKTGKTTGERKTKKTRTTKSDEDQQIMDGIGIAIGVAGGIRMGGGKHRGGDGKMPGSGGGSSSGGGYKMPAKPMNSNELR
jgi:hypothetical protein